MSQTNDTTHAQPTPRAPDWEGDDGVSMTTVVVMLVVLAVLVVGLFWVVPSWFGGGLVTVSPR
ncbi:MAG: hypothetical protein IT305_17350 [Chloroflexi bacterium]|nr:hypothetical protein [Chloroflexota bacterium]